MAFNRLRPVIVPVLLGAAAIGLAACGRSGAPMLPPGPAVEAAPTAQAAPAPAPSVALGEPVASGPTAQEIAQKNGFDASGNPVAPVGQKKSFPLDFLLQ
ncbi:MAG TPA: hypothetical protein VMV19_13050 [Xanthobacteraceae bacterium]|nr:hypothetical protein [Xanthobacteraceae bacterium]